MKPLREAKGGLDCISQSPVAYRQDLDALDLFAVPFPERISPKAMR
jgi:hypothetical protein